MGHTSNYATSATNQSHNYNLNNHHEVHLEDNQTYNNHKATTQNINGNTINGNVDNLQGLSNSKGGYQAFKLINLNDLSEQPIILMNLVDTNEQHVTNKHNVVNNHSFDHQGTLVKGNYHDLQKNDNYGLQTIGAWMI